MDAKPTGPCGAPKRRATGLRAAVVTAAALLVLAVAAVFAERFTNRTRRPPEPPAHAEREEAWRKFQSRVRELRERHDARNRELFDRFRREAAAAGEADYRRALGNVDGAVARFGDFATCGKLLWAMADDRMRGGNSASVLIAGVLGETVVSPCAAAARSSAELLNNFTHRLQENDNLLRAEVALGLEDLHRDAAGTSVAARRFLADLGGVSTGAGELAAETALASLGTAFELLLLRQTAAAAVKLTGKSAAKLGISAAAPFADGPLPVGDVIALVGFGWSVYDICRIKKVLPGRMAEALRSAIEEFRNGTRRELLDAGRRALAAAERSSAGIAEAVK